MKVSSGRFGTRASNIAEAGLPKGMAIPYWCCWLCKGRASSYTIMRTPALRTAEAHISTLNTHHSLSAFIFQFFVDAQASSSSSDDSERFTSDVFPKNIRSRLFNVRMEKLTNLITEREAFLAGLFVSRCNEIAKDYFSTNMDLLADLGGPNRQSASNAPFFERLADLLNQNVNDIVPGELRWTLDHLRCRRNCLVHRNAVANNEFESLARNHGTALNRYWDTKMEGRAIDFRSEFPDKLTADGMLYVLRTTRVCLEEIDARLCTAFSKPHLHA